MSPSANRRPPFLHLAVLCSYVELDGNNQPFRLVEPMYGIALTPRSDGRLPCADLDLFVQLEDEEAAGTYWFSVEVRNPKDQRVPGGCVIPNGKSRPEELTFPSDRDPVTAFEHVFTLRGLVFPEPGWYHFHVMCNHMSMHERERSQPPIRLHVLAAELPTEG